MDTPRGGMDTHSGGMGRHGMRQGVGQGMGQWTLQELDQLTRIKLTRSIWVHLHGLSGWLHWLSVYAPYGVFVSIFHLQRFSTRLRQIDLKVDSV